MRPDPRLDPDPPPWLAHVGIVRLTRGRPTSGVVQMLKMEMSDAVSLKGGQPAARNALKKVNVMVAAASE